MITGPRTLGSRAALVAALVLVLVGAPRRVPTTADHDARPSSRPRPHHDHQHRRQPAPSTERRRPRPPNPRARRVHEHGRIHEHAPSSPAPTPRTVRPRRARRRRSDRRCSNAGASASPAVPITRTRGRHRDHSAARLTGAAPAAHRRHRPPSSSCRPTRVRVVEPCTRRSLQRVWAVDENGVVIKTHRVSGRLDPLDPRPGVYSVYSRSLQHVRHPQPESPGTTWSASPRQPAAATSASTRSRTSTAVRCRRSNSSVEPLSGGCVRQARRGRHLDVELGPRRHRRRRPGLTVSPTPT